MATFEQQHLMFEEKLALNHPSRGCHRFDFEANYIKNVNNNNKNVSVFGSKKGLLCARSA